MRICAIQEKDHPNSARRPYIFIEVGTEFQTEFALFNTGADVNSLSYKVWDRLGKPNLCESKTTLTSFSKDTNPIEGYLDLPIFIGNTNVHHRFYVMKPGKANMLVILGQPWQRTYNKGHTTEYPIGKERGLTLSKVMQDYSHPSSKMKTLLPTQNRRMKKISLSQRSLQQPP